MTVSATPQVELQLRGTGITYALRLMDALHTSFKYMWKRKTTFHFLPFSILETAAVLCSCILHDCDGSIQQRYGIFHAIDLALDLLKSLSAETHLAKTPYDKLLQLSSRLDKARSLFNQEKRVKIGPPSKASLENSSSVSRSSEGGINKNANNFCRASLGNNDEGSFPSLITTKSTAYLEGNIVNIQSFYGHPTTHEASTLSSHYAPEISLGNDEEFNLQFVLNGSLLSSLESVLAWPDYGVIADERVANAKRIQ